MVSVWSMVFMAVAALVCVAVPAAGMIVLATRKASDGTRAHLHLWRPFLCGALAFFVSQVLTRLPLMAAVVPRLPEPISGFLLSAPVASYTAGLFEETGRLVVMILLLKGFHRFVDGVAFGLGHGGLEAVLLVGLSTVSNIGLAVVINSGQWSSVAASMPPEVAQQMFKALTTTPPATFLLGGVERVAAVVLHVCCSLLVLWGVHAGRRLLAWAVAVLVHGSFNLVAVLLAPRMSLYLVEALLLVLAAALATIAWRSRHRFAPRLEPPAVPAPAAAGPMPPSAPGGPVPTERDV